MLNKSGNFAGRFRGRNASEKLDRSSMEAVVLSWEIQIYDFFSIRSTFLFWQTYCQFALDFYQVLTQNRQGRNLVFSPISLHIGLGMLYLGASNKGKEELGKVLHITQTKGLERDYYDLRGSVQARTANSVWISDKDNFKLKTPYKDAIKQGFKTDVFVGNLQQKTTVDSINTWTKHATKNAIPTMIESIDQNAKMLLVNAIFFEDAWKLYNDFDGRATKPDFFSVTPFQKVSVSFMNKTEGFAGHYAHEKFQMASLPYEHINGGFYIILPEPDVSIEALEKMITLSNLQDWIAKSTNKAIERFSIPKIKMDSDFSAAEVLKILGVKAIFDSADTTNFENMGNVSLYANQIMQKTHITVDEEGTTVASITTTEVHPTESKAPRQDKVNFIANRPFIFFVYDKNLEAILFWGRISNPSVPK